MPKRKLDPLPAAAFQILLSLAEGELHGYAIMRQVSEQTGGRMRLGPGTLYSSIQTLLDEGCIEEVAGSKEGAPPNYERRRYYRLTDAGRKPARSEAERLSDLIRIAQARGDLGAGLCLRRSMPSCYGCTRRAFERFMRKKHSNCFVTACITSGGSSCACGSGLTCWEISSSRSQVLTA